MPGEQAEASLPLSSPALASPHEELKLFRDSGKFTRVFQPVPGTCCCWLHFPSPRHCQIFRGAPRPGNLLQKESSAEVTWNRTPEPGSAPRGLSQLPVVLCPVLPCPYCPRFCLHRPICAPLPTGVPASPGESQRACTSWLWKSLHAECLKDLVPRRLWNLWLPNC